MAKAGVFRKKIPALVQVFAHLAPHELEDLARALKAEATRKRRNGARTFTKRRKPAEEGPKPQIHIELPAPEPPLASPEALERLRNHFVERKA